MPRPETILVVDDDAAVLRGLDLRLHAAGYDTILCQDGSSGLASARDQIPDAVILDGGLPDMEGAEFIRSLHALNNSALIPVIVVSGAEGKRNASLDAGAVAFLMKPYERDTLLATIRNSVGCRRVDMAAAEMSIRNV